MSASLSAGSFGNVFAVVEQVVGPIIDDDDEHMVWIDCAHNVGPAGLDSFDGGSGRAMLEDDVESGEASVQIEEGGEEYFFCVKDGNVVAGWGFAV